MKNILFVSGWLRKKGAGGVGIFEFDDNTGMLKFIDAINTDLSFGSSIKNEDKGILYVLCNKPQDVGLKVPSGGAVCEIHFDKGAGKVKDIKTIPVYISNPCNLSLAKDGKYMVISGHGTRNYVSKIELGEDGKYHPAICCDDVPVMLLEINPDGSVGDILDVVKHEGSGPLPKQQTAHPHCVTVSPDGSFFVVCDKGNDSVFSYTIDEDNGKLVRNGDPIFTGSAVCPRYCAFNPETAYVYHNSENSPDIYTYSYDKKGILTLIGISNGTQLPEGESRPVEGQGLNVHPSGKYLYNVTNGTNTIDVFSLEDPAAPKLIQSVAVEYGWPRGQVISKNGKFLLLSCADGGKILPFSIVADGRISRTGVETDFENAESMTIWS